MAAGYELRVANAEDADVVARHRAAMFRDMGMLPNADFPRLVATSRTYLRDALAVGGYLGWLVERDGEVVAGAGVLVFRGLPRPERLEGGDEAYVLNVYTEPSHRRRGLARQLMETILRWCGDRGITRIALHASDEGRPLYERLGFGPTNEMRLPR